MFCALGAKKFTVLQKSGGDMVKPEREDLSIGPVSQDPLDLKEDEVDMVLVLAEEESFSKHPQLE